MRTPQTFTGVPDTAGEPVDGGDAEDDDSGGTEDVGVFCEEDMRPDDPYTRLLGLVRLRRK
jgi:hypothetical protein